MNTRRRFITAVLSGSVLSIGLFFPLEVFARRGRVRLGGRGIAPGMHHSGPSLNQDQLRQCVLDERAINKVMDKLDRDEVHINQQESQVNQFSQQSVDQFNALVERFNAEGASANAHVTSFNSRYAGLAYYDVDIRAVLASIGNR